MPRPGPGTQPHLGILSALGAIKAEGVHVPFTGAGPMTQAMLAGTVMAMSESTAVAKAEQPESCSPRRPRSASPRCRTCRPCRSSAFRPRRSAPAGSSCRPRRLTRWWRGCRRPAPTRSRATATGPRPRGSTPPRAILPEAEFRAMFEADSVRNAEAVKKAGITQLSSAGAVGVSEQAHGRLPAPRTRARLAGSRGARQRSGAATRSHVALRARPVAAELARRRVVSVPDGARHGRRSASPG